MKRLFLSLFLLAFLFSGCTTEKPAATTAATETTPQTQTAAFSPISETVSGFAMTPDGGSVPVQLTLRVENVLEGDAAYQQLLSQGCEISAPEDGSEYALISVTVTYDDGEPDTLDFVENYPASLASARVAFHLSPNASTNAQDMTAFLENPIWNQTLTKGGTISGDILFLQDVGNTQPLYFEGYGQAVTFAIH